MFKRLKFQVRRYLSKKEYLFFVVYNKFSKYRKKLLANSDTDLIVEGFPRSANTHCVASLEYCYGEDLNIAHHTHAEAQISYGIRKSKPIVVTVRDPLDSVVSYKIREPNLNIFDIITYYVEYYGFLKKNIGYLTILNFNDAIKSPMIICDIAFSLTGKKEKVEISEEELANIIEKLNIEDGGGSLSVSRPNKEKKELSKRIKKSIEEESALKDRLLVAQELYESIVNR